MSNKKPSKTSAMTKSIRSYEIAKPADMARMANVLKSHVIKNKLYTTIVGKNYAHVEGWQFAGGLLGLFPRIVKVEDMTGKNGEYKWMAEVELIHKKTGEIVSRGFAICSKTETKKKSFEEYAILSMAQTRAIGKAYRNILGWVMKLAGYEGTPSEEMRGVADEPAAPVVNAEFKDKEAEVCKRCPYGNNITKAEKDYSKKVYGKELCRDCQKDAKAKKGKK